MLQSLLTPLSLISSCLYHLMKIILSFWNFVKFLVSMTVYCIVLVLLLPPAPFYFSIVVDLQNLASQMCVLQFSLWHSWIHTVSTWFQMPPKCAWLQNLPQALAFLQAHFIFKSHLLVSPKTHTFWNKHTTLLFCVELTYLLDWIISNELFFPLHSWWSLWSSTSFFVSLLHQVIYQVLSVLPSQLVSYSLCLLLLTATTTPYYFTACLLCWSFYLLYLFLLNHLNRSPGSSSNITHGVIKCLNLLSLYWNPTHYSGI